MQSIFIYSKTRYFFDEEESNNNDLDVDYVL